MFGDADFAWADGLRRAHFPPERNQVPAHLTLFHHLPPTLAEELHQRLRKETANVAAPAAQIVGVSNLGRGVALRVRSDGLATIRAALAEAFAGLLTPQDAADWRPHITIQNKVEPPAARALLSQIEATLSFPTSLHLAGLASWYYVGGPWQRIESYRFR